MKLRKPWSFFAAALFGDAFGETPSPESRLERYAEGTFLAFVFFSMVSLPLARAAMLVSFVLTLACKPLRRRFRFTGATVGWLSYFVLALLVTGAVALVNTDWGVAHGYIDAVDIYIEPARGFRKLTKLLWYLAIPLSAVHVADGKCARKALGFLVCGGLLLAFVSVFINPVVALLQYAYHPDCDWINRLLSRPDWAPWGGRPPAYKYAFTILGTMHNAQRLMAALIISVCTTLTVAKDKNREKTLAAALVTAFIGLGLIFTCKRGPLLVGIGVSAILMFSRLRWWKTLAVLAVVALAVVAEPHARHRLMELPNEFQLKNGGRALMWTKVVPKLHEEYPYGLGFRSLTALKMHNADWHVEKNRTHVHSVPLEAFVDFGYPGPAVWLFWMVLAFIGTAKFRTADTQGALSRELATAPLAVLSSLVLFSFVEYNLADAAVVLLYAVTMGFTQTRTTLHANK